jgi:biuret amidohydrolase
VPPALAALVDPSHTALLLQEVQEGVVGKTSSMTELAAAAESVGVLTNAVRLATAARAAGAPVVHCTAETLADRFGSSRNARLFAGARKAGLANFAGSEAVRPIDALGSTAGDVVLPRFHGLSPMTGSPLDSLLRNEGVTTVVVAGVSLNIAIPNLVFDAVNRSYQVVVTSDAVAGLPIEYGEAVLRHALSLVATICPTDALVEAWAG